MGRESLFEQYADFMQDLPRASRTLDDLQKKYGDIAGKLVVTRQALRDATFERNKLADALAGADEVSLETYDAEIFAEEFRTIMRLRGVQNIRVENDALVVTAFLRVDYKGKLYDFEDWDIRVEPDQNIHGVDGRFQRASVTAKCIRVSVPPGKKLHHDGRNRYAIISGKLDYSCDDPAKDHYFCFGEAWKTFDAMVARNEYVETVEYALINMSYVKANGAYMEGSFSEISKKDAMPEGGDIDSIAMEEYLKFRARCKDKPARDRLNELEERLIRYADTEAELESQLVELDRRITEAELVLGDGASTMRDQFAEISEVIDGIEFEEHYLYDGDVMSVYLKGKTAYAVLAGGREVAGYRICVYIDDDWGPSLALETVISGGIVVPEMAMSRKSRNLVTGLKNTVAGLGVEVDAHRQIMQAIKLVKES